jgi:hypothetical protein
MRKVRGYVWIGKTYTPIEGDFHEWSQTYEELETGLEHYPVAIVETHNGQVCICPADTIQFLDKG